MAKEAVQEAQKTAETVIETPATTAAATTEAVKEAVAVTESTKEATTEAKTEEVPTESEYDLKAPEGSRIDASDIEEVKAFAKENKLSVKAAQQVLDQRAKSVSGFLSSQTGLLKQQSEAWAEELKADPVLGGKNFKESTQTAHAVVEKFGSENLKKMLNGTALGNHPDMFRFLHKLGLEMVPKKEIKIIGGEAPQGKSPYQKMYPTNYKENEQ